MGILLIVSVTATPLVAPTIAEAGKISPAARWVGQAGKVGGGDAGYICSREHLAQFWKKWAIATPQPQIDFALELAVYYMGSGGPHLMNLELDASGNLVAEYVETPTASRHPNYLIFTVPRSGVKSLNGTPVHCPDGGP